MNVNIDMAFLLAGKAMFTVFNGLNDWYTFKVNKVKEEENIFAVEWFAGTDNSNNGSYGALGTFNSAMLSLDVDIPRCKKCNAMMTLRHKRSDNTPFWGCSNYPKCSSIQRTSDNYESRMETAVKAFRFAVQVLAGKDEQKKYRPTASITHVARCRYCRKLLTTPESIALLIGPECAGRHATAPVRAKDVSGIEDRGDVWGDD